MDAPGTWSGNLTRDKVPMGYVDAKGVRKGMSGGPVRRLGDDWVVGVVSGRYNAGDGWGGTRCGWPAPRRWQRCAPG
ncbi:MAG: hypothetical protein ACR2MO_13505 [Acidimicrobiales bacterium]